MFRVKDDILDFIIKSYNDKSLKINVSVSKVESLGFSINLKSYTFRFESDIYLIINNEVIDIKYLVEPKQIYINREVFDFCGESNEDITSLIIEAYMREVNRRISLLVKGEKDKKVLDFKNINMMHEGENINIITRTRIE